VDRFEYNVDGNVKAAMTLGKLHAKGEVSSIEITRTMVIEVNTPRHETNLY
jgi:hypothetical protein